MNGFKNYLTIFALSIIAAAILFFAPLWLADALLKTTSFFEAYVEKNEILGIAIFTALAAFSAILSPFSSVPLVPIAVMLWGSFFTFVMLFSGWLIGDVSAYLMGRFAGYPLIKRLTVFEKIEHYKSQVSGKMEFWLVLLFRFAAPSEVAGYVLGVLRVYFGKYFLATFLAELPFALLTVYASEAFIRQDLILFIVLIAALLILTSATFYLFHKRLKRKGNFDWRAFWR